MSASDEPRPSSRARWRAPAIGAMTGLVVAAAIVVPQAIASSGQTARPCVAGKFARAAISKDAQQAPAPGGVPHQFIDAIAQLQQAGTITADQARRLDTAIESGRIDPDTLVADHVVTAAQMQAVNAKLIAIKMSLAAAAHPGSAGTKPGAPSTGG